MQVVTDPGGPKPSSWRTHRLCLESLPEDATHLVCLQDDALLCADFEQRLFAAISAHPARLLALFVPGFGHLRRPADLARKAGRAYMEMRVSSFLPLVGVVYPAEVAREIPSFADARRMPISRADDAVVATFVRMRRIGAVAPLPCLVEHRTDVESAMGMRPKPGAPHRQAVWFDG